MSDHVALLLVIQGLSLIVMTITGTAALIARQYALGAVGFAGAALALGLLVITARGYE